MTNKAVLAGKIITPSISWRNHYKCSIYKHINFFGGFERSGVSLGWDWIWKQKMPISGLEKTPASKVPGPLVIGEPELFLDVYIDFLAVPSENVYLFGN